MSNQEKMPFVEALEAYKEQHFVPFHTPGHKIGVEASVTKRLDGSSTAI